VRPKKRRAPSPCLATGDAELVEGPARGRGAEKEIWRGVWKLRADGSGYDLVGRNWMGQMMMAARARFKQAIST